MTEPAPVQTSPILQALQGERPDRTPVWFMRQAGRILPEYRKLKEKLSFLELIRDPAIGAEVTLMPMRRFEELDAAILFTDLLVPLEAMGVPLDYNPGPVLGWTFEGKEDLDRFEELDVEDRLAVSLETAERVRAELPSEKALLGFVGAPFTLAAYMCEGKGSKTWARLRGMAYRDRELFEAFLSRMTDAALAFGLALHRHGCEAIQVFDSWAGVAEPVMFREQVGPHLNRLVDGLQEANVPVIYYVNGALQHLDTMYETGADCLGVDWRVTMDDLCDALPKDVAIQGNLDPTMLFGSPERIEKEVRKVLDAAKDRPHIFNLGHGLEPTTPVEGVEVALETLRTWESEQPKKKASKRS